MRFKIELAMYGLSDEQGAHLRAVDQSIIHISDNRRLHSFITNIPPTSGRILIARPSSLEANQSVSSPISTALEIPTFHLLLLEDKQNQHKVSRYCSHARVNCVPNLKILDEVLPGQKRALHQDLSIWYAKTTLINALQYYEQLYAKEPIAVRRPPKLIARLKRLLGASVISVYLLNALEETFRLKSVSDGSTPIAIPRKVVDQAINLTNTYQTVILRQSPLCDYFDASDPHSTLVISTFLYDLDPGFVIYRFGENFDAYGIWTLCHYVSREIFHIIRGTEIRTRLDTLEELVRLRPTSNDTRELIYNALEIIKDYFHVEGATLIEISETRGSQLVLERTAIHHRRRESESYSADHGCAHVCISKKVALLVNNYKPLGKSHNVVGYSFSVDDLTAGSASRIELRRFKTPNKIERESSLICFPLITNGDVLAVIKLAYFTDIDMFDLRSLRDLSVFAEPIAAIIARAKEVRSLREQLATHAYQQRLTEQAETLFFYREIALGVFHQLSNHLETTKHAILDLETQPTIYRSDSTDIGQIIKIGKEANAAAKSLVSDAQKRGLTLRPISSNCRLVRDIIRPVLQYAEKRTRESGILVRHSLTSNDYSVFVDPKLTVEAIINVITNAVWAVKENVRGGKREIFVAVRPDQEHRSVRIEISDSGVGMTPDQFQQVAKFLPFVSFRDGGTGLGLYFTNRLMQEFGGSMSMVKSQPGKGTTVELILPVV